jgi:transposase
MTLRPQSEHQTLQAVWHQQSTTAWKTQDDKRAGIAGTLSQGVRAFGLRLCRYRGLSKTRLQHPATAVAINIDRLAAWLDGHPHAKTWVSRFAALAA